MFFLFIYFQNHYLSGFEVLTQIMPGRFVGPDLGPNCFMCGSRKFCQRGGGGNFKGFFVVVVFNLVDEGR